MRYRPTSTLRWGLLAFLLLTFGTALGDRPLPHLKPMKTVDTSTVVEAYDSNGTPKRLQLLGALSDALTPGIVNVDAYGATGDDNTQDQNAIQTAIEAAGVGGTVIFSKNQTYLIGGAVWPREGQTIDLNGAILKRIDQIATTSTASISIGAGPTDIPLADATGFEVGMDVIAWETGNNTPEVGGHKIIAKNGNTITVVGYWANAMPSGANIATGGKLISNEDLYPDSDSQPQGIIVRNGVLDGNKANNPAGRFWETMTAAHIKSHHGRFEDLEVKNSPGNGLVISGDSFVMSGSYVHDTENNGIIIDGDGTDDHISIIRNRFVNTNAGGFSDPPGHDHGAISISTPVRRTLIKDNYFSGMSAAIGNFNQVSYEAVISGNVFYDLTVTSSRHYIQTSTNPSPVTMLITGNLFIHSTIDGNAQIKFDGELDPNGSWTLSNNFFVNVVLNIQNGGGINIVGNSFVCDTPGSGSLARAIGGNHIRNISIIGNRIDGHYRGVELWGSDADDIHILSNDITNVYESGVKVTSGNDRVVIRGNNITQESTDATITAWRGIIAESSDTDVAGNTISIMHTATGAKGILGGAGGASINGALVHGNTVRMVNTAGGQKTIEFPAGSQGNFAHFNYVNDAVNDLGAGNTVANNILIN